MKNNKQKKQHQILSCLIPYKGSFSLACITIILENALEISLPFLMNVMLKNGMTQNGDQYSYDPPFVFLIGGIMLIFAVLSFFLGLISSKMTAKAGRGFGYELRKREYQKIQEYSFTNLDQFRANSLITRMTSDVQIISDTFCQVMRPILRGPFQLIFASIFALSISKELSLVFLCVIPILALLLGTIIFLTRPKFYQMQAELDHINRTTDESLTAMKLVRANAKENYEIQKFDQVNKNVSRIGTKANSLLALNMGIMQMMTYACVVAILLVGGSSIFDSFHPEITAMKTAADIATFLSYATQTLASLMMICNVMLSFTRASASLKRLKEVFAAESEIIDKKDSPLRIESGRIEFDHVSFRYSKEAQENVLSDLNFTLESGQTIGILGETGAGKSTLIYLIDRFYDTSEGAVRIDGKDIKDYSLSELRGKVAICFQSPRLFKGTVKENLLWGNIDATEDEILEACEIACCKDFILHSLSHGFDTEIAQGGDNVSGGQRQRLCIARAILAKPKILILDDSFSALDRITEKQIKQNLQEKLPGTTKLIISQKVSSLSGSDQIIVLKDGKVNNIGTSEYLKVHDPIYQDIYRIQEEGGQA